MGIIKRLFHALRKADDSLVWEAIYDDVRNYTKSAVDFFAYVIKIIDIVEGILKGIGVVLASVFLVDKA